MKKGSPKHGIPVDASRDDGMPVNDTSLDDVIRVDEIIDIGIPVPTSLDDALPPAGPGNQIPLSPEVLSPEVTTPGSDEHKPLLRNESNITPLPLNRISQLQQAQLTSSNSESLSMKAEAGTTADVVSSLSLYPTASGSQGDSRFATSTRTQTSMTRPQENNVISEIKEDVGRKIFIHPADSKNKNYNFDPVVTRQDSLQVEGVLAFLFYPLLLVHSLITSYLAKLKNIKLKGEFIDNAVRTAKYNVLDFFPKQLLFQFSKVGNMYFLFVSMLQLVPDWSPTGQYTTIFPLTAFVGLAMLKEGWEDYARHKQDALENGRKARRLRFFDPTKETPTGEGMQTLEANPKVGVIWEEIAWKDLRVGDLVKVEQDEPIPADIVLLGSSQDNGICYIETSNLDGESNLKIKQSLAITSEMIWDIESLASFSAKICGESPTDELYRFEGYVELDSELRTRHPLTISQMLPRGTTLANTDYIFGAVLYTGEETKIRRNAASSIRSKTPSLEILTNKIIIAMLVVVLVLAAFSTLFEYSLYRTRFRSNNNYFIHWYLEGVPINLMAAYFSFVILYNTMIPISLYVAMEFVKLLLSLFINSDLQMYDEATDTPALARTSNLHEDLGQVQYLFTDKTGTLTENVMQFRKLSVNGESYIHGLMPTTEASFAEEAVRNLGMANATGSSTLTGTTAELLQKTKASANTQAKQEVIQFLLAMALCHTVSIDKKVRSTNEVRRKSTLERFPAAATGLPVTPEDASLQYQSSSPDEVALVQAARELSFVLRARTAATVTVNILQSPTNHEFRILHTIAFSSERRRMSVIYRFPDGKIVLICKGADSVILERLRDPGAMTNEECEILEKTMFHLAEFAAEGLRTLLYASRALDPEEYTAWAMRYEQASLALERRSEMMQEVAEEIECGLHLLGATAIEDRLQKDVPNTIENLRRAGIKIWMLTGDKRETAINIGYTCSLAKETSHVVLIEGPDLASVEHCIEQAYQRLRMLTNTGTSTDDTRLTDLNADAVKARDTIRRKASKKEGIDELPTPLKDKGESINMHVIAIIDGETLRKLEIQHNSVARALEESIISGNRERGPRSSLHEFIKLGMLCDSVICCRFSPSQKALIVSKVKEIVRDSIPQLINMTDFRKLAHSGSKFPSEFWRLLKYTFYVRPHLSGVTLAIGDGANDIPMLQSAHVGVGITGREGLAASRASDYSIAQFRFLQPLLFVHGRYAYVRISLFTLGTFYKCFTFYLTQLLFQIWTGWSGTSLYEQWTLALYNVAFTLLPVIVVGVFEKDLNRSTLLGVPELYQFGMNNRGLNTWVFLQWMVQATWHAGIAIMIPALMYNGFYNDDGRRLTGDKAQQYYSPPDLTRFFYSDMSSIYQETSLYVLGLVTYTSVVFIANVKVTYVSARTWTIFHHISFFGSIAVWWLFFMIYPRTYPKLSLAVDAAGWQDAVSKPPSLRILLAAILSTVIALLFFDIMFASTLRAWSSFKVLMMESRGGRSAPISMTQTNTNTNGASENEFKRHAKVSSTSRPGEVGLNSVDEIMRKPTKMSNSSKAADGGLGSDCAGMERKSTIERKSTTTSIRNVEFRNAALAAQAFADLNMDGKGTSVALWQLWEHEKRIPSSLDAV
ncbi:hypothetical protein HDU76_003844 [Blyttiomyces sp. JEL0837]|nr:hypothetical protein HDU76_003844 [Blyttiomyces sp. JEL0837]